MCNELISPIMDAENPETNNIICRGCLSVDRLILPIKYNMDLFLTLLGDNKLCSSDNKEDIYLCFECSSLLRKVEMFRRRIQTAQDVLTMLTLDWTPIRSLSHLTITKNEDFNLISIEEQEDCRIKIECNESISNDANYSNTDVKEEFDDMYETCFDQNLEDNVETVESRESKKLSNVRLTCKVSHVVFSDEEKDCFVVREVMKLSDIFKMPKKKKGIYYKDMLYSCSRFISRLADLKKYDLKKTDDPDGLECAYCKTSITNTYDMKLHWDDHTIELYKCTLCSVYARHRREIIQHLTKWHTAVYQCKVCVFKCWKMTEYNNHFRQLHKYFICDHCNRKCFSKSSIERHIRRNHLPHICRICSKSYKNSSHLHQHMSSHETAPTELTYCVECDLQFRNQYGYRRHLRTSVAHRPRKIVKVPCPECGKVFSRKVYMNNHYRQVHVRKTPHYCDLCDKYFINGYAIRTHIKFVHDKYEKPKDKICDVCNRGFHTNRVLINHKRTHTGEKPYACSYCSSAFAQLQARKTHERTQHKNMFTLNS